MNLRGEPRFRLERLSNGEILLHRRGDGLGDPLATFAKGEEVVAERVLAMLNTFTVYDSPGSPTWGPIRDDVAYSKEHPGTFFRSLDRPPHEGGGYKGAGGSTVGKGPGGLGGFDFWD